jgi:hypothetical protein
MATGTAHIIEETSTSPSFEPQITYVCEPCNFKCCKKGDWSRHTKTIKHVHKQTNVVIEVDQNYNCYNCSKKYNSRVGLWSHKKKCGKKVIGHDVFEKNTDKELILMLINEQNKMKDMIADIYNKLDSKN